MAPRPKSPPASTIVRQSRTGRHRKPRQAPTTRKSLRLQNKTPVSHISQAQPIQSSPNHCVPIPQTAYTKRKRSRDSEVEVERPAKQPRRSHHLQPGERSLPKDSEFEAEDEDLEPPPVSSESEEELRTVYEEVMDYAANSAPALKRTSSRRSTMSSEGADTVRSQRSSNTTAHYRYTYLKRADIHIHVDPPVDIQAAIDDIINAKPSEDRHALLHDKAKEFSTRCKEMVRAATGEDDFVHLFYNVIEDISPDNLISREKADWRVVLKPTIQQSDLNLSFLSEFNARGSDKQQEIDDALPAPPPKRHQQSTGHLYISPKNTHTPSSDSPSDNRRPQLDKAKETSTIKTPRPDITTGIKESSVISALVSFLSLPNFNYTKTERFLETLQDATMPAQRDGPQEPVLIIVPTERPSNLSFPTLISEAKGYSTGKQVFEAQNQAAVSGACGINIQLMLDELIERTTRSSDAMLPPRKIRPPLVFSVCSEGPHYELWAHYTVIEDDQRKFKMVLLDTGHGVMPKQVEKLFVQIDNILNWTTGPFLKSVVEGLGEVAKKTGG